MHEAAEGRTRVGSCWLKQASPVYYELAAPRKCPCFDPTRSTANQIKLYPTVKISSLGTGLPAETQMSLG